MTWCEESSCPGITLSASSYSALRGEYDPFELSEFHAEVHGLVSPLSDFKISSLNFPILSLTFPILLVLPFTLILVHALCPSLLISSTISFTLYVYRWESNSGTPFRPEVSVSKSSTNDVVSTPRPAYRAILFCLIPSNSSCVV